MQFYILHVIVATPNLYDKPIVKLLLKYIIPNPWPIKKLWYPYNYDNPLTDTSVASEASFTYAHLLPGPR